MATAIASSSPLPALYDAIVAYYEATWLDYRILWLNDENLAMHFGYYDDAIKRHADALRNANRVLADRVSIRPGERVLDAGCGVGGSSLWLAQERGARIVGINLVASQLERAKRLAAQHHLADRVTFAQEDYTNTSFASGSFDVVWAMESLCHAPDKGAFYREAARLLRPGGRLVIAEYVRSARPVTPAGETLLREFVTGWAIPDLDTRDEHLEHAAAAGFTAVNLEDATARVRPSLLRLHRLGSWLFPLGIALHRLRLRSDAQHGNVIAARRQYQALEGGFWFYGILSSTRS